MSCVLLLLMGGSAEPLLAQRTYEPVEYQPSGRQVSRPLLVVIGRRSQLDTYLSPVEYKGPHMSVISMR